LITPAGTVVRLAEDADLLRAARVSVGTLGMLTELTLSVIDAYHLDERIVTMTVDEVLESWERLTHAHRHFSFFWLPTPLSAALYGLEADVGGDVCLVKIHDLASGPATAEDGHRVDRAYRIYPAVMEANFDELEYMVPIQHGRQAFLEIRELVQERFSDCIFPVEVRFTKADDGMLSPNFAGDTAAISVSGHHGTDYWDFLRAADEVLDRLDGRPHWGKLHFLTRERVDRLYPEAERFRELRRELDPGGRFLNDSLRELLG
jgi:FAD/FMN-containing dehydrogenase